MFVPTSRIGVTDDDGQSDYDIATLTPFVLGLSDIPSATHQFQHPPTVTCEATLRPKHIPSESSDTPLLDNEELEV